MTKATKASLATTDAAIKKILLIGEKEELVELFGAIQASIQQAVPEAYGKIAEGWRALLFHHPKAGYFCGVFLSKAGIKVVFEWGRYLNLPEFFSTKQQIGFWSVDSLQDFRQRQSLFVEALLESVQLTKLKSKNGRQPP